MGRERPDLWADTARSIVDAAALLPAGWELQWCIHLDGIDRDVLTRCAWWDGLAVDVSVSAGPRRGFAMARNSALVNEEPAARAALAGLPLTATFRGEVTRNGEVLNTSSGYVNFTGDCREESSVEAAPGSLESQSYTRVDVVRSDGSTYARVTDDGTGEWVDARQGIGPFVTSFTPAAVAYTSDNAIGVCGLADLPMWVAGAGAGGGWDIDVERAGAYLRAVTDEHLAWMLRDPSLDDASRGNAVATFEEMRRAGAYDADYDAVLTGARIDVTADSVTYSTADGGYVQTWRFTPSPPRSVSAPPGAEPTTPALVL